MMLKRMLLRNVMLRSVVAGLLCGIANLALAAGGVEASDGWVRWVPEVSTNSAAYFTLQNHGDKAVTLVSASSAVAGAVELHAVIKEGELMKMQKQNRIELTPHQSLRFQPGGYHVMLIGLKQPLKDQQAVAVTLQFADGTSLQLELIVRKDGDAKGAGTKEAAEEHHHDHHH